MKRKQAEERKKKATEEEEESKTISDHIEDIKEHLEANPKYDSVAEVVSHLDIDLPGFPGDEIFEKAEAQIAAEIKKIKGD